MKFKICSWYCRHRVVSMFHHAYDGYLKYAYPYDELRPLSCDGHDTWGRYHDIIYLVENLIFAAFCFVQIVFCCLFMLLIDELDISI